MNCAACGAPVPTEQSHCRICGSVQGDGSAEKWDRAPEAVLYESLQNLVKEDESLLSATRGRIGGSWRSRSNFSPFAFLAPYANIGLTGDRLLIQQVHPRTGEAIEHSGGDLPLSSVASIQASDADPFSPGRTARLIVVRNDGESFRVRAVGRLAEAAHELAEVWQSLSEATNGSKAPVLKCERCGRETGRAYRYCPFCGAEQGAS
jgi:hypothetical protein